MSDHRQVLIATSELLIQEQVGSCVLAKGYQIVAAERGCDALLAVVEQDVGLVILDLSINEPSGVKTVEILRKIRPRLPVVVLSGDTSLEAGRQVLQHGVFYYLLKPLDLEELDQIVRIALASNRQLTAGVDQGTQEWRPAEERGGVV